MEQKEDALKVSLMEEDGREGQRKGRAREGEGKGREHA